MRGAAGGPGGGAEQRGDLRHQFLGDLRGSGRWTGSAARSPPRLPARPPPVPAQGQERRGSHPRGLCSGMVQRGVTGSGPRQAWPGLGEERAWRRGSGDPGYGASGTRSQGGNHSGTLERQAGKHSLRETSPPRACAPAALGLRGRAPGMGEASGREAHSRILQITTATKYRPSSIRQHVAG